MRALCIGLLLSFQLMASAGLRAQDHEITVGSGFSLPPYMIDGSNRGLLSEIIVSSFSAVGTEVDFHFGTNLEIMEEFKAFQTDAVINATSGAFPSSYLSDVVITFKNRAISLRKNNYQIQQLNDLLAYSVVGFNAASKLLNSDFQQMVAQHEHYSEIVKQIDQANALLSGTTDAIIADELIFKYYRSQLVRRDHKNRAYQSQVNFHPVLPETHYRIAFHDENLRNKFNQGLSIIKNNGLLAKIHQRYEDLLNSHIF
jgi:polar amino acid transport system substrate-binding protein